MLGDDATREVHEAIKGLLDDGEIPIKWTLVIDVVGSEDTRYLAHHSGGGHDGTDAPTVWDVLGMAESFLISTREEARDCTHRLEDVDDEDIEEIDDE
jgi:hypothetical protein